jgi:hypothetical protein
VNGAGEGEEGEDGGDPDENAGRALPDGLVGVLPAGDRAETEGEDGVALLERPTVGDRLHADAAGLREVDHLEVDDVQVRGADSGTHVPQVTAA